jgi:hypothetical protein
MGGAGDVHRPQQRTWNPDPTDTDQAEEAMQDIAAGNVDETWTAAWLKERVRFVNRS